MAQINVLDCLQHEANQFELVLLGAERARQLRSGEPPTVEFDGEPATIVALREIATGTVDPVQIRDRLITKLLRYHQDGTETDAIELEDTFGGNLMACRPDIHVPSGILASNEGSSHAA